MIKSFHLHAITLLGSKKSLGDQHNWEKLKFDFYSVELNIKGLLDLRGQPSESLLAQVGNKLNIFLDLGDHL